MLAVLLCKEREVVYVGFIRSVPITRVIGWYMDGLAYASVFWVDSIPYNPSWRQYASARRLYHSQLDKTPR